MSSIADRGSSAAMLAALSAPLQFVWSAWRRLTLRQWSIAGVAALAVVALGALSGIEQSAKMSWDALLVLQVVAPVFSTLCFFLAWAIADAVDDARLARHWRVVLAVVAAATISSIVSYEAATAGGYLDWIKEYFASKGRAAPGRGAIFVVDAINALILGGLVVAVAEVNLHRLRSQRALEQAAREQAGLARQLLESRLAAMQAQVEPQFLFDSLVDVQALYERNVEHGAGILDRLIAYLRVALPRLRESGSNVQTEVDLVRAYLDVVAARHQGRPLADITVDPAVECERFYPMLLLPLVQRAIRISNAAQRPPADRIELAIGLEADRMQDRCIVARLRIHAPGLCAEDADLARVRERLDGLTDGRAQLKCEQTGSGITEFTLRFPHSSSLAVTASADVSHSTGR